MCVIDLEYLIYFSEALANLDMHRRLLRVKQGKKFKLFFPTLSPKHILMKIEALDVSRGRIIPRCAMYMRMGRGPRRRVTIESRDYFAT